MSTMSQAELGEVQEKLEAVQRAARDFLKGEWSTRAVRELEDSELGFSAALWKQLRELGWPGMLVPEARGGQGGSFIEFAGLAEELGRALAASTRLKTLDWSPLAEVAYEDVAVGADRLLAQGEAAEKVLREVQLQATLAACAELLGVATTAHEMAVEYAKERVAFGRPIGVFQAV